MNDRTERGAASAAMVTELGEWAGPEECVNTPTPGPYLLLWKGGPGPMLPDPRPMLPARRALFHTLCTAGAI